MIFTWIYWICVWLGLSGLVYLVSKEIIRSTNEKEKYRSNILKKYDSVKIDNTLKKSGYAILTFTINRKKYNFLLDTGSAVNMIDTSALHRIVESGYELLPPDESYFISGIDGNTKKTESYSLGIRYGKNAFRDSFVVKDLSAIFGTIYDQTGYKIDGLLGMPFFDNNQWIFDFEQNVIWIKSSQK